MTRRVEEIEGIGIMYAQKLVEVGVKTDADLLERTGSAKARMELTKQTGITNLLLLKWANHADLMRISGIGPQFAELLEAAGVDTVKELAKRNAMNLTDQIAETNRKNRLAGKLPAISQVAKWINLARKMEPRIYY